MPDRRSTAANPALQALGVDLSMVAGSADAELVHSHTWYANMAGHLAKLLLRRAARGHRALARAARPWKAEQLGGGYRLSSWVERTAYEAADAVIAVSAGMRDDVLDCYPALDPARVHVVHNGIDTELYRPDPARDAVVEAGIDPDRPHVVFVGRITRQKGVGHLLAAAAPHRPRRPARPAAPAHRTRPRSPRRPRRPSPSCRPAAAAWSGCAACCPPPRSASC